MADQPSSISPVKLGFAVTWPAFWTGVPIKIVIALILLAFGNYPWEMPGLAFLILLSIPIDIWALGLSARTVFLERLRLDPPDGLGLTLWAQIAGLTVVYAPLAWFIERTVVEATKSVAAAIMDWFKSVPVAERITVELNLWGVPSTIVFIVLLLVWLSIVGRLIRRQAVHARPASAPYDVLIRRWDLLRVPADMPLMLAVFTAAGVLAVVILWAAMPVTTPHPHPDYKKPDVKAAVVLKPAETLHKTEKVITQAEAAVEALEAKDKGKGKGKGHDTHAGKPASAPPAKVQPAAAPGGGQDHHDDGHKH
jgi:hypothetical protein